MTQLKDRHPAIDKALNLDGNPDAIRELYEDWADNYDNDVFGEEYGAAKATVEALTELPDTSQLSVDPHSPQLRIADVGCGTGLVGVELWRHGFRTIDGFDLSPAMIEKARQRGIYRHLHGNVDITQDTPPEWQQQYDAVVCCGVFTSGHVPPTALEQVIQFVKVGGIIALSTRKSYYEASQFQAFSDSLEANGYVKLLRVQHNGPYTDDETGHYWSYVVLK